MSRVHVKMQPPPRALEELERTERARSLVASIVGVNVCVPEILASDPVRGSIDFAHVDAVTLRRVLLEEEDGEQGMRRAGTALGGLHRASLGRAVGRGDRVFLHGDYSIDNVLVRRPWTSFAIVDWSSAPWAVDREAEGDPRHDVMAMLISLFYRRPFSPFAPGDPRPYAAAFLQGYEAESGYRDVRAALGEVCSPTVRAFWRYRAPMIGWVAPLYGAAMFELIRWVRGD